MYLVSLFEATLVKGLAIALTHSFHSVARLLFLALLLHYLGIVVVQHVFNVEQVFYPLPGFHAIFPEDEPLERSFLV